MQMVLFHFHRFTQGVILSRFPIQGLFFKTHFFLVLLTYKYFRWKIQKESVKVDVTEGNTELPANSLTVQGYDVTGKILTADGNPVQNTIIALFTQKKASII